MSNIHVFISDEYRARALTEAGGPLKVSRWLNRVVLPAFFNPSGVAAMQAQLAQLKQENDRLKGEIAGLRFALSTLRPASIPLLTESADNGQRYDYAGSGTAP